MWENIILTLIGLAITLFFTTGIWKAIRNSWTAEEWGIAMDALAVGIQDTWEEDVRPKKLAGTWKSTDRIKAFMAAWRRATHYALKRNVKLAEVISMELAKVFVNQIIKRRKIGLSSIVMKDITGARP